ncbi:hypothetical protein [Tsukamurella spumae]|uniref:Uncharacterized protein n=1 Tax=Tsukamurella spumae TaxID=44753 RepID=A0A846X4R3_9ACTN|nr:hypothetical protein [Tsukamurella spumae]NKY19516.1 hypothetical protein [Tsukamurella spumae]
MDDSTVPPVVFAGVNVEQSPIRGSYREVSPRFTREPGNMWAHIFRRFCQADEELDWQEAGFVRCRKANVENVETLLREACAQANLQYARYLATLNPAELRDIVEVERIQHASGSDGAYALPFPSFRTY